VEGVIIVIFISKFLLVSRIIHLIYRKDLFKIGNLVLGGKEIVISRIAG